MSSHVKSLRVQCFGEFEVRYADERVSGFESQKVRALLAYLACHADRALSRDHLAALLWPEKSEEAARGNLRQALYNIRRRFPGETQPLSTSRQAIRFSRKVRVWVDVLSFEEALDESDGSERGNPHLITEAVGLYRGDFLAGFHVKGSTEFDSWLLSEQHRLRERAIAALRRLVDNYLARGAFRLGIQYAQRLVGLDAMSEEAHRKLMQLYALSGRRGRALGQFVELASLLDEELGVEPMDETKELRRRILSDQSAVNVAEAQEETIGPIVPLVNRRREYAQLHSCLASARSGEAPLTLLTGVSGVGKSRLARSFLDGLTSDNKVVVLKGRCFPEIPFLLEPFSNVFHNVLTHHDRRIRKVVGESADLVEDLATINPESNVMPDRRGFSPRKTRERIFDALIELLRRIGGKAEDGDDFLLVITLDDLEGADPAAIDLLRALDEGLLGYRVWILAALAPDEASADHPVHSLIDEVSSTRPEQHLVLDVLSPESLEEISSSLVGVHQAPLLADFLARRASTRLPLQVVEWVNYLWDEGLLVSDVGRWHLKEGLDDLDPGPDTLDDIILRRLHRLPASTRRLAFMACLAGPTFESDLVSNACDEHPAVVEIGLSLMLERWMVRRYTSEWQHSGQHHDLFLWSQGTKRGHFEFTSQMIRRSANASIDGPRRKVIHNQIAARIEELHGSGRPELSELLAYHYGQAGNHERAWGYLLSAGDRALQAAASDTARDYYQAALDCVRHMRTTPAAKSLEKEQVRIEGRLKKVA